MLQGGQHSMSSVWRGNQDELLVEAGTGSSSHARRTSRKRSVFVTSCTEAIACCSNALQSAGKHHKQAVS